MSVLTESPHAPVAHPERPAAGGGPSRPHTELRRDIQALRAFAVSAVLIYHLLPDRLTGGFVGVDIFFVISGFLITGNLLREIDRSGRIRLGRFWARRARRLFPAAGAVLLASAVATLLWVPQNLWRQFFQETIAASLYAQNWLLSSNSVDYLASTNTASPAQHFWTLSVEEQFYIAVPVLMALLLLAGRRLPWSARRTLFVAMALLTAGSFAYCVWLTSVSQPTAYFVTHARAWEFGVGALLAFGVGTSSKRWGLPVVLAGIAALVAAVFVLSDSSAFPGYLAAWPVLATGALIWAGRTPVRPLQAAFALPPVQFLGRISYAVYLWHWAILVLLPYATGHSLTSSDKALVVVATVLLAWASTRWLEEPIRRRGQRALTRRASGLLTASCAAAMAVVVAFAAGGLAFADRAAEQSAERVAQAVAGDMTCLGADNIVNPSCSDPTPLGGALLPEPAFAASDSFNRDDCWSTLGNSELNMCTLGPVDAPVRLVAIGDSHSNALLAGYEGLARRNGWRIDVAGHNGCYFTRGVQAQLQQSYIDSCEEWKRTLRERLASTAPYDALLTTFSHAGAPVATRQGEDLHDATVRGLTEEWAPLIARGTQVIAVRDNPEMRLDVVSCVTEHGLDANDNCSRTQRSALLARDPLTDAATRTPAARLVDLTDIYCPGGRCTPVIGSVVVYVDPQHLTGTFSRTLTPVLDTRVRAALREYS